MKKISCPFISSVKQIEQVNTIDTFSLNGINVINHFHSKHYFCCTHFRNIMHGSDAVESAKKEIALWFTEKEVVGWSQANENWIYE